MRSSYIVMHFFSAAVACVPFTALAGETVDLTPRTVTGAEDFIQWDRISETRTGESPLGPAKTEEGRLLRTMQRKVLSSNGETSIRLTFDRLHILSSSQRGPMEYDSDAPKEESRLRYVAQPALGKSIDVHYTKDGKSRTVTGMDDIFMDIEEQAAGKFVFEPLMVDFTDDSAQFEWVDLRLAPYAFRAVEPGDKWSRRLKTHHLTLGSLVYDIEFRLTSIANREGRRVGLIAFEGTINQPGDARKGDRVFNIASRFKRGGIAGEAEFDAERGQIVEQSMRINVVTENSMLLGSVDAPAVFTQDITHTHSIKLMSAEARRKARTSQGE